MHSEYLQEWEELVLLVHRFLLVPRKWEQVEIRPVTEGQYLMVLEGEEKILRFQMMAKEVSPHQLDFLHLPHLIQKERE